MGYHMYKGASQTLAYTLRPPTKTGSRYTGGLCLLASDSARTRVCGQPAVNASHISISLDGSTIAGIYLQPTMPQIMMEETLAVVREADVVLGDINVHYNKRTGMGTPRDRATLIARWAQASTML